jgi:hypothetical protein
MVFGPSLEWLAGIDKPKSLAHDRLKHGLVKRPIEHFS